MAIPAFHHGLSRASSGPGVSPASLAQSADPRAWSRQGGVAAADLGGAPRLALMIWLTHFMVSLGMAITADAARVAYLAHLGIQFLITSAAFSMLSTAGVASSVIYRIVGAQALVGASALLYSSNANTALVPPIWILVNLLSAMLLTLAMAARTHLAHGYLAPIALAGSMIGIGICIDQVMLDDRAENAAILMKHLLAFFLLVLWQLLTRREAQDFKEVRNRGLNPESITDPAQPVPSLAVTLERQRIAKELHDGVASQIVSILSSLGHGTPERQELEQALEQCLLDLKLTVDGIESADQNIVEALGSLRYRVQRPLDKLGIRMVWEVEMCPVLETVRGEEARQLLRIAQECLSNVMRHTKASRVVVACRYVPGNGCMEFEVRDNGRGISPETFAGSAGKGLDNMRQRARAIGGELMISSKSGAGTRVQFTLPVDPELFGPDNCRL